jgi:transposase InsO family protein
LFASSVGSGPSNGIAEAFVKTFKRDYARLSILPDAATIIALLPVWFEDYNEVHPHSGLKSSPQENFFASVLSATKLPVRSDGCTPLTKSTFQQATLSART